MREWRTRASRSATTGADTTSAKALGSAAYAARKKVLDAGTNEIPLGPQLVVPANGYLVLVASVANAGIEASDQKLAQKKLKPATEDYNTMGLGLPFPADDLDNFFRNGGTLNLGYADITAATGSGHGSLNTGLALNDDGTPNATHADYTGYNGATTNAYAKPVI